MIPPINLEYRVFENEEKIREYLLDDDYLLDDEHMGVCFGYSIVEKQKDDFEIKLIFNDQT